MIFVTVGTHEQPFNRLVQQIDQLKGLSIFKDEVIIQKGYSTFVPQHCRCFDVLPYEKMLEYQQNARIIITHGGPASFIYPLSIGKIPIVVPRQKQYSEHVNDHQLEFCRQLKERNFPIILIEEIKDLSERILNYNGGMEGKEFHSHNVDFVKKFKSIVDTMFVT